MKLLGIDLSNLLLRHAANPYRQAEDNEGRNVRGPVGALAQIIRLVQSEKPTHLLLAKDGPREQSLRRAIDPEYKAHRPDADDEIRYQFQFIYRVLRELSWPLHAEEGYEADDILASAAHSFEGRTVIVSGDKDLLACVSTETAVLLLRPGEVRRCEVEDVEEIFGVPPERVVDWKALVGDSSDGISGVPGIGPQRAKVLLDAFGDLGGLLAALGGSEELSLPGITAKQIDNLRMHEESAKRSYELARLRSDVTLSWDDLLLPPMPQEKDIPKLQDLGLGSLVQQLFPEEKKQAPARKIDDIFDSMW